MEKAITGILKDTAYCFLNARRNIFEGAAGLHTIFTQKLFLSDYTTFGAYVEQECQISQSYATKLIKAYDHYVLQGGISQRKLESIDMEKAYLALSLPGTPEKQLAQAETLTRQELKAERASQGGVEHECEAISICKTCSKRLG